MTKEKQRKGGERKKKMSKCEHIKERFTKTLIVGQRTSEDDRES